MATLKRCAELVRQLSALGAVSRGIGRALPPDCPPASLAVLGNLDRFGEMRLGHLAERLGVDVSVTSRHVAHLAALGWIDRQPEPQDKRSRLLRLTADGERVLGECQQRIARALAVALESWTDDDVGELAAMMARLRESFDGCRPRSGHPWAHQAPAASADGAAPHAAEQPSR